ncbi:response regulator transcription factor [Paenibacillus hamazuiensis]|uniref:response regulator transcription factor n=1 Tax=Paenibacillus hamazuiensis TaxID=2936508 RepID=UPI002010BCED|nr:response regulator transcription factor [Paenibacillus hamazuiensis]
MQNQQASIRVLICEDNEPFGGMLADFLQSHPDLEIVGVVGSKPMLMERLKRSVIDILILDMHLQENIQGGLDILMELREFAPHVQTIVLSSFDREDLITDAFTFGQAVNYITKRHYRDLPEAIREVHSGRSGLHHSSASRLLRHLTDSREKRIRERITDGQLQILRMLNQGMKRKEIAETLYYTEQSINNEICKVSALLKGSFPYLEWLRLKKHNLPEILRLAKQLNLIP